jgi:4-hydroxy-2-oxoheptanedioate aldolase
MEHGSFGIEAAVHMIRATESAGAAAIVRVPDHSRTGIQKVLDAGAAGVIAPSVHDRAQTEAIVSAARFAPVGTRGACPCTGATGHGVADWKPFLASSAGSPFVSVLIETPDALANFNDIISVPGLDAVVLGPFDLSQAMGHEGDYRHPEVQAKLEDLTRTSAARGIRVMAVIFDSDPDVIASETRRWTAAGAGLVAVSGDRFMLASGYKAIQGKLARLHDEPQSSLASPR